MAKQMSLASDLRRQPLRLAAGLSDTDCLAPRRSSSCIGDRERASASSEAAKLLDVVRHAMDGNPEDARVAALRLVALFTPLVEATPVAMRGGLAPWQQRRIDRYVREHLEQPIRVDELAAQVSLSVSHFCRAFKESFGDSPHAYIIRLRLDLAKELMLTTDNPLSQISLACGFAHQAHLSKLFRHIVRESPNAWRRRNLIGGPAETSSGYSVNAPECLAGTTLRNQFGTQSVGQAA